MQIMRHNDLGFLLDRPGTGPSFRKLLLGTVLATDMGVHAQFMQRFTHLMEKPSEFTNVEARTLLCQALIKCADISNVVSTSFRLHGCRVTIAGSEVRYRRQMGQHPHGRIQQSGRYGTRTTDPLLPVRWPTCSR